MTTKKTSYLLIKKDGDQTELFIKDVKLPPMFFLFLL
jgi:hypothetical protein